MIKSDIITNCLDEILAGRSSLEDCLGRYPEVADELRFSLAVVQRMHAQKAVISPEFRQNLRERLLVTEGPVSPRNDNGGFLDWLTPAKLLKVPLAILTAALGLVGGGATIVYASQSSLPGDALYPVKIGSENVRLALTINPESKAELNLKLAERRVEEVVAQSARRQNIDAASPRAIAGRLDAAIKEIKNLNEEQSKSVISQLSQSTINQQVTLNQLIGALPEEKQAIVEETIDTSRRGSTVAVVAEANPAFLGSSPSTADKNLEETYFKLQGTLLSTGGGNWNIGGITLRNVSAPQDAVYSVGRAVSIEGIVRGDKTFISKITQNEESQGSEVTIGGIFKGSGDNGNWLVGGVLVSKPQNISPVSEGTRLKLTGLLQNGVFVVTKLETGDIKKDVNVTGKLVEVDKDVTTISIEVAGARITVRLRDVQVRSDSGKSFEKSILPSLVSKDIKVSDLRISNGALSAARITIADENLPKTGSSNSGSTSGSDKESSEKSGEDQKKSD